MTDAQPYEVIISPAAEADLDAISDYLIQHDAADAATRLMVKMLDRVAALDVMPWRGNMPKELEGATTRGYRQFVSGPYRVIYHVGAARVTVVLVADGRRDMVRLFHERALSSRTPED